MDILDMMLNCPPIYPSWNMGPTTITIRYQLRNPTIFP